MQRDHDWDRATLKSLIGHILTKHHEYLRRELPLLDEQVCLVSHLYGEGERDAIAELPKVFEDLYEELTLHMRKEEMMLFPVIEAYEVAATEGRPLPPTPFGSVANPIRMMQLEHDSATGALSRIRDLTSGYSAPDQTCSAYETLFTGLQALEADLQTHIHLENDILFPRAIALERAADSRVTGFGI